MPVDEPRRFRFTEGSRARVEAQAPGHQFTAEGPGISGTVDLSGSGRTLSAAEAVFSLSRLDAGDALRNHELRRFLATFGTSEARGRLLAPVALSGDPPAGDGRIELALGTTVVAVAARFSGAPPLVQARLSLSFTAIGRQPPRLLFLKVRDGFEIEVTGTLEPLAVD